MPLPIDAPLQGGKYRIVRFIASGGFGCTYEAIHSMLRKRVAIKEFFVTSFCIREESTGFVKAASTNSHALVGKLKEKFLEEARSLCQFNHHGIVKVTDVFEDNGTAYFVMDYIEGDSLAGMVKKYGPLPERQAVKYILDVCSALEYVHARNRLHLDIKPANIIVDDSYRAILIDFGASKQYDEINIDNDCAMLGRTPGYSPPEQLANDVSEFHPSTDIYSMGATLYKLLTGKTPPDSHRLACGASLPPLPKSVSQSVGNAVSWALQLDRLSRPQSVNDFRKALNGIVNAPAGLPGSIAQRVYAPQTHYMQSETATQTPFDGNGSGAKGRVALVSAIVVCVCLVVAGIIFLVKSTDSPTDNGGRTDRYDSVLISAGSGLYMFGGPIPQSGDIGVFRSLSNNELSVEDLEGYSKYELRLLRNAIFALHGYKFRDKDLTDYFSRFSNYAPHTNNVLLNEIEKYNVSLLKNCESLNMNSIP